MGKKKKKGVPDLTAEKARESVEWAIKNGYLYPADQLADTLAEAHDADLSSRAIGNFGAIGRRQRRGDWLRAFRERCLFHQLESADYISSRLYSTPSSSPSARLCNTDIRTQPGGSLYQAESQSSEAASGSRSGELSESVTEDQGSQSENTTEDLFISRSETDTDNEVFGPLSSQDSRTPKSWEDRLLDQSTSVKGSSTRETPGALDQLVTGMANLPTTSPMFPGLRVPQPTRHLEGLPGIRPILPVPDRPPTVTLHLPSEGGLQSGIRIEVPVSAVAGIPAAELESRLQSGELLRSFLHRTGTSTPVTSTVTRESPGGTQMSTEGRSPSTAAASASRSVDTDAVMRDQSPVSQTTSSSSSVRIEDSDEPETKPWAQARYRKVPAKSTQVNFDLPKDHRQGASRKGRPRSRSRNRSRGGGSRDRSGTQDQGGQPRDQSRNRGPSQAKGPSLIRSRSRGPPSKRPHVDSPASPRRPDDSGRRAGANQSGPGTARGTQQPSKPAPWAKGGTQPSKPAPKKEQGTTTKSGKIPSCPFKKCGQNLTNGHAFSHVPALFHPDHVGENAMKARLQALLFICGMTSGHTDLQRLANWIQGAGIVQTVLGYTHSPESLQIMEDFGVWYARNLQTTPEVGKTVGVLAHWMVIAHLLSGQTQSDLNQVYDQYPRFSDRGEIVPRPSGPSLPAQGSRSADPRAFDSHCHLDRMESLGGLMEWSLQELMRDRPSSNPKVEVVGVVSSCYRQIPTIEQIVQLEQKGIWCILGAPLRRPVPNLAEYLTHLRTMLAAP